MERPKKSIWKSQSWKVTLEKESVEYRVAGGVKHQKITGERKVVRESRTQEGALVRCE